MNTKAPFFLIFLLLSLPAVAQIKRKCVITLDTTLNPEKYEAVFSYIPERAILKLRNLSTGTQAYAKVVKVRREVTPAKVMKVALSERAYIQLIKNLETDVVVTDYYPKQKLAYDLGWLPENTQRMHALYQLANYVIRGNGSKADSLAKAGFKLAQKLRNADGITIGHYFLSRTAQKNTEAHLQKYLVARKKENNPQKLVWAYKYASRYYASRNKYQRALGYALPLLNIVKAYPKTWNQVERSVFREKINYLYKQAVNQKLKNYQADSLKHIFAQWRTFLQKEMAPKYTFVAYKETTQKLHQIAETDVGIWYVAWQQWARKNNLKDIFGTHSTFVNLCFSEVLNRYLAQGNYDKAVFYANKAKAIDKLFGKDMFFRIIKHIRELNVDNQDLYRFLKSIQAKISARWFTDFMEDTRAYLFYRITSALNEGNDEESYQLSEKLIRLLALQKSPKNVLWTYQGIARVYASKRYFNKAIKYYKKVVAFYRRDNNLFKLRQALLYLSTLYRKNANYVKALEPLVEAVNKGGLFPLAWVDLLVRKVQENQSTQTIIAVSNRLKAWKDTVKQEKYKKDIEEQLNKLKEE